MIFKLDYVADLSIVNRSKPKKLSLSCLKYTKRAILDTFFSDLLLCQLLLPNFLPQERYFWSIISESFKIIIARNYESIFSISSKSKILNLDYLIVTPKSSFPPSNSKIFKTYGTRLIYLRRAKFWLISMKTTKMNK